MIGQRLSEYIKIKKVSPAELARKTGKSKGYLSNIFNNTGANPTKDFFDKLAIIFPDLNINWLLTGQGKIFLTELTNKQDCINLPFISASAGGGIYITEEETYPVPINEIQKLNINFNNLALVKVIGPSMKPIINNNDILVINKNYLPIEDGEIYVLNYGNRILCKRLLTGATYTILKSENPEYPPEKIEGQEIEKLNIVGKVIYRMNRF